MALLPRRDRFAPPPTAFEQQLIPVVSVMLGSLAPLLPMIVTSPIVPPFGFMMLLGWRLLRNDLWPVWAALPLGAFDDLFSGAPIGTAMSLWTVTFIARHVFSAGNDDERGEGAFASAGTSTGPCGAVVSGYRKNNRNA
jgi:hypothetical protein